MSVMKWLWCIVIICIFSCAAIAEGDIYLMGPDDAFYHSSDKCGMILGEMYLVTPEAAREFLKTPCPQCAGEVEIRAQAMAAVTVIEAKGPEDVVFSVENAIFEREINGVYYFIAVSSDVDDSKVRAVYPGGGEALFSVDEISENDAEAVVSIYREEEDEFSARDVFGLRLCDYSNRENSDVTQARVCLFPEVDEFTGIVEKYGLEMASKGYSDRGICHYWLLTREEYAMMDMVYIHGEDKVFAGDVYFDPFFTGDETPKPADDVEGWQLGPVPEGMTTYKKDPHKMEKEDDFCGLYLGSSGHYVVSVKNPTKKRARQYAKIAGGDIWVIQGEYTQKELNKARKKAEKIVEEDFASSSVNPVTNRVEIEICGADIAKYADRELFEPCVNVTYEGETVWERGAMAAADAEISRPPISQTDTMGIRVYMEREEYPVGAEYISFCIDTDAEFCAVSLVGTLEKYTGEAWKKVAGDYLPQYGRVLKDTFDMPRTIVTPGTWSFKIPAEKYEQLGEGLYRLTAVSVGDSDAVVEFAITTDAAPMEKYIEKRPDAALPSPAAHMPASSAPGYDSRTDDFSSFIAGGWEFSLIWLPEELWDSNDNRLTAVVAWPEGRPEETVKVYEAEEDNFRMFNSGDGIVLLSSAYITRMDYDGKNVETLVNVKKGIKQALMLDGDIYYLTNAHLWRWRDGGTEKIWSPKKGTGETLEYYDEKLLAQNAAGKMVEIDMDK